MNNNKNGRYVCHIPAINGNNFCFLEKCWFLFLINHLYYLLKCNCLFLTFFLNDSLNSVVLYKFQNFHTRDSIYSTIIFFTLPLYSPPTTFPLSSGSVQFSCSIVSNSLWPHGLQHTRPPCPLPTPRAYSNSRPSSRWCHPAISFCRPLLLLPPIPPSIRVFSNESTLCMRWPEYWSFSFSIIPSKEIPGLISFT